MVKLNLGCGKDIRDGYINIDIYNEHPSILRYDVSNLYSFETNSVDEILALDILEHFPIDKIDGLVGEWCRVLKSGGELIIQTPDVERVFSVFYKQALEGKITWERLARIIYGGQDYPYNFHYCMFSEQWIKEILQRHNMIDICVTKFNNQNMKIYAKYN
jgi:predicted SAM-dependent methyltransferase